MLLRTVFSVAVVVAVAGCGGGGGDYVETTATVNYKGQPLEGAMVSFFFEVDEDGKKSTVTAIGTTDASGKCSLQTNGKPGAPKGNAKVTVVKTAGQAAGGEGRSDEPASPEEMEKMAEQAKSAIPEKYGVVGQSGLTAEVTDDPDKNNFTFDLTD